MLLTEFVAKDFRGFREFAQSPAPRLTLILAMNGVGKTSIIEGLAIALGALVGSVMEPPSKSQKIDLCDEQDHRRVWGADPRMPFETAASLEISASGVYGGAQFSWQVMSFLPFGEQPRIPQARVTWGPGREELREKLLAASRANPEEDPLPLLAVLGAQRSLRGKRRPLPRLGAESSVSPERLVRWTQQPYLEADWYKLRDVWFELENRRGFAGERAEMACQSIANSVMQALEIEQPPLFNGDAQDFLVDLPGEGLRAVGLMSDGWRSYVSTIVGLATRCAEINPLHAKAGEVTPGVLLIDELEQHLHPALQLEILDGLRRAFPRLQIIGTTHSPLVLTDAADDESTLVLRLDREPGEDVVSSTRLRAPIGRDAVQVLTGDWFGLESTYDDETLDMLAKHRSLLRQGDAEAARLLAEELRRRIRRYAETSMEQLVVSIVADLEVDERFQKLSHAEIKALREEVIRKIRAELA